MRRIILFIVVIIQIAACKKGGTTNNPPATSSCRITKIDVTPYTPDYFHLKYDDAGKLTTIEDGPGGIMRKDITYADHSSKKWQLLAMQTGRIKLNGVSWNLIPLDNSIIIKSHLVGGFTA